MSDQRKIGDTVVSFTSRRGVKVFRQVIKRPPNGELYITPRFQMRVHRGGRRVLFQLPSTVKEAGKEADEIDAFLDLKSNTLDMAIKKFDPDRWERHLSQAGFWLTSAQEFHDPRMGHWPTTLLIRARKL